MSWYNALRDVLGWVRDKQDSAIVYWLLKYRGSVTRVADELSARQTEVVVIRRGLVEEGYLRVTRALGGKEFWDITADGRDLLDAFENDRDSS